MRFGVKLCSSSHSIDLPKIRRPKASRSDGKEASDSVWKKAVELRLRLQTKTTIFTEYKAQSRLGTTP